MTPVTVPTTLGFIVFYPPLDIEPDSMRETVTIGGLDLVVDVFHSGDICTGCGKRQRPSNLNDEGLCYSCEVKQSKQEDAA